MTNRRDTQDLAVLMFDWALASPNASYPLADETNRIGRSLDCEVVLDDASVSRHHATITFVGERPRLEDAGSRHGTTVNGQRIEAAAPLKHGDRIGIGGVALVVQDLRRVERAQRDTLQIPALNVADAVRTLRSVPPTGEHDPVSAMLSEIQLLVDAGEGARAATLIAGLLKNWSGPANSTAIDEGTLRRGSTAILRAVSAEHPEWVDALVTLHRRRGVLMHASTLDQLEAATQRAPKIDWAALASYAQWLETSGVGGQRGEYGRYCLERLGQILRAREA